MAGLVSMAVAVAEHMGLTAEEILRGVAAYQPADNRLRVERLAGGRMMINDSYNANPRSVSADLRILAQHKTATTPTPGPSAPTSASWPSTKAASASPCWGT